MAPAMAMVPLVFLATALAAPDAPPEWSVQDLQRLAAELSQVRNVQDPAARDLAFLQIAGRMYAEPPARTVDGPDAYARQILKRRSPDMYQVKEGQEIDALLARLYADVATRCRALGRFETDRHVRRFLQELERGAEAAVAATAPHLQFQVEGLEGFFEPLARSSGEPPSKLGALVKVHSGGVVTVEKLDRVRFENHQPPQGVRRTDGAIHELMAAQKQYNISAELLGRYEPSWRRNRGHVQLAVPGNYPSRYLNEVVRSARLAGMHTLHVLVVDGRGELQEIPVKLQTLRPEKGSPTPVEVECEDAMAMQECVARIRHASLRGRPYMAASS